MYPGKKALIVALFFPQERADKVTGCRLAFAIFCINGVAFCLLMLRFNPYPYFKIPLYGPLSMNSPSSMPAQPFYGV